VSIGRVREVLRLYFLDSEVRLDVRDQTYARIYGDVYPTHHPETTALLRLTPCWWIEFLDGQDLRSGKDFGISTLSESMF